MVTVEDVIDRLETRAANHGLEVADLLEKMPSTVVDTPQEVNDWLDTKEISHKLPVSTHPHLQNDPDNWVWEDPDVNRARGAEPMTELEVATAELDNKMDAKLIDGDPYDELDPEWMEVLGDLDVDVEFPEPPLFPMF